MVRPHEVPAGGLFNSVRGLADGLIETAQDRLELFALAAGGAWVGWRPCRGEAETVSVNGR